MSHENVVEFMKRLVSDEALRARVGSLEGDGGWESVSQLLQIAEEEGHRFAEGELDELILAMAAHEARGELTPEQLDGIAGGTGVLRQATRSMRQMSQGFSLAYAQLQQKMQGDNRQFTLMSNIMKTKHDTAKSAINNIR